MTARKAAAAKATVRAGVYLRISSDPYGLEAGVKRQDTDCAALCAQRGWQVAERYTDNDVSAYTSRKRPAFEQMMSDLADGRIDAVVVYHIDRLYRQPRDLERFLDLCDTKGVRLLGTCTGDIDLGTDDGRFQARILCAVACKSSDDASRRIKRAALSKAQRGEPSIGGLRPFGYEVDRVTVNKAEAKLINEAVNRILAGDALHAICRDWRAAGVVTPSGNAWVPTSLRNMLKAPRITGLRAHTTTAADGRKRSTATYEATWAAIVERKRWQRMITLLAASSRRTNGGRHARYLLTGMLTCGICKGKLTGRPRYGVRRYGCHSPATPLHLARKAEPLEDYVTRAVFARLNPRELARTLTDATAAAALDGLLDQIAEDERGLEQLSRDHYVDGIIGRAQFLAASAALEARVADRQAALAKQHGAAITLGSVPGTRKALEAEWAAWDEAGDTARQRALIATYIEGIELLPYPQGAPNTFAPDLVQITWRTA